MSLRNFTYCKFDTHIPFYFSITTGGIHPTLETMSNQVMDYVQKGHDPGVSYTRTAITRDDRHKLYTQQQTKKFAVGNTKCRVLKDYTTLPYGY